MTSAAAADQPYDLLVVGGGINGAGIACDAAGRGLSVLLCEAGDLAGATSSASSKLIHGGLRYLEHYEFRLVRESLKEREILMRKAPHIVHPLRFVLPHATGMRPAWMLRIGLFLYDHLYRRKLIPGSGGIDLMTAAAGAPLADRLSRGFTYWDCWVDDARLVVFNAMAAAARGAAIMPGTKALQARVVDGLWQIELQSSDGGEKQEVRARALVNAAGPWVNDVISRFSTRSPAAIQLVKGSHIVVPRIRGADDAYILQNHDGRIVFVLPFDNAFSLIGTTDKSFHGDPANVDIDDDEQAYLLDIVTRHFKEAPTVDEIIWSFAGVRPLFDGAEDDPSKASRDYRLRLERGGDNGPPLLSILGGKITTYRKLAEHAMAELAPFFPGLAPPWTADVSLPGGQLPGGTCESALEDLAIRYSEIDPTYLAQLIRRHGSLATDVLGDSSTTADLGADIGGGIYEREVRYFRDHEWARHPDDVLWRRSKAGLYMTPAQRIQAQENLAAIL